MGEKFRVKGSVYEVNLQYHSKIEGYTTLMSDILELGDVASLNKRGD